MTDVIVSLCWRAAAAVAFFSCCRREVLSRRPCSARSLRVRKAFLLCPLSLSLSRGNSRSEWAEGYFNGLVPHQPFQSSGFGSYETSRKRFKPSPLGLCGGGGGGSLLASSNLVSMELCRSERREWLLAGSCCCCCSLDPWDVDLVASSVRGG